MAAPVAGAAVSAPIIAPIAAEISAAVGTISGIVLLAKDVAGKPAAAPPPPSGTKMIPGTVPPLPSTGDAQTDAAMAATQKAQQSNSNNSSAIMPIEFWNHYKGYIIGGLAFIIVIGLVASIAGGGKK